MSSSNTPINIKNYKFHLLDKFETHLQEGSKPVCIGSATGSWSSHEEKEVDVTVTISILFEDMKRWSKFAKHFDSPVLSLLTSSTTHIVGDALDFTFNHNKLSLLDHYWKSQFFSGYIHLPHGSYLKDYQRQIKDEEEKYPKEKATYDEHAKKYPEQVFFKSFMEKVVSDLDKIF